MKFKSFKLSVLLVLLVFFSICGVESASAKWRSYPFYNYSGKTVKYLYITGGGMKSWGKDLLGKGVLKPGQHVSLRYSDDVDYFDIKVVYSDGEEAIWWNYDYNGVWRLSLYRDGRTNVLHRN